jgi:FKBP-type peptidyl-prolyl cis-trans isomerase FklB
MRKLLFVLTAAAMIISACKDNKNFISSEAGFEYRYIHKSDSVHELQGSDIVSVSVKYFYRDSLLFNSKTETEEFVYQLPEQQHLQTIYDKALLMMNPADSLHFLIPAKDFYENTRKELLPQGINADEKLLFHIKLEHVLSDEEILKRKKTAEKRRKAQEHLLIQNYLSRESLVFERDTSGVYVSVLEKGHGKGAEPGDRLKVHYEGRLLNGLLFDSSVERAEPFVFTLGEDPIIEAWEKALYGVKKGSKIRIIAPYGLAYGAEGFGQQIPPYASLIFDIKILDIN